MATLDDSPSLFSGKPWTVWSDTVEKKGKTDIKEAEAPVKTKDDSDSMKLRKADMPLYGLCPARDEFYLVVCECCGQVIKPQALRRHIEQRHGNLPGSKSSPSAGSKSSHGHTSAHGSTKSGHGMANMARDRSGQQRQPKSKQLGPSRSGEINSQLVVELERIQSPLIKKPSDKKRSSSPLTNTETPTTSTVTMSSSSLVTSGTLPSMPATLSPLSSPTATTTTTMTSTTTSSVRTKGSSRMSGSHSKSSPLGSAHNVTTPLVQPSTTMTSSSSNPSSSNKPMTSPPVLKQTALNPTSTSAPSLPSSSSGSRSATSTTSNSNISSASSSTASSPARKILPSLVNFPKPEKLLPCKDREYDANKHCGVWAADVGKPCTRSLTCKTHALSLRRKVEGRRKPFDDLLKEHKEVKEAMLKAKAEMKAAEAAAKLGKSVPIGSSAAAQLTSPTLTVSVTTTTMTAIQSPPGGSQTQVTSARGSGGVSHSKTSHQMQSPIAQAAKVAVARTFSNKLLHSTSPRPVPLPVVPSSEPTPPPETCSHLSSDGEDDVEESRDQCGYPHLAYHPRPAAVNTFGARLSGGGCFVFSRKTDLLHAAFKAAVERHLHPPPHKKLCVESRLPLGSNVTTNIKDPYEFGVGESSLAWGAGKMTGKMNKSKSSATSPSVSRTIKPKDVGMKSPNSMGMPVTVTSPPPSANMTLNKTPPGLNSNSSGSNLKRKRSGSSPSPAASSHTTSLPGNIAVSTSVSSPISIAIPTASLNLSLGNPGLANLNAALSNRPQQLPGNKNSFLKDINIVVTSMDPNVVNGQLVSIPGANLGEVQHIQLNHLAETAKSSKASAKQRTLATLKSGTPLLTQNSSGCVSIGGTHPGGPVMMDTSPPGVSLGHVINPAGIVVTSAHVSTPQPSPSTTPSPLFAAGSTSPQVSATSPLPNGILSPPGGLDLKSFTVNHLAPPGSQMAGIGGASNPHLAGSLSAPVITVADQPHQQQHNSGSHSRAKGSRSSNSIHKQQSHPGIGMSRSQSSQPAGVGMAGTQQMFTTIGKNRVVMTGAPAVYSRQMLNASKFSHIQIQPKGGGGKTITAGKLAMHPVSLTIPIATTPGVATTLAPPAAQARALILPTEDHHKRDLSQNSSHNVLS